MDIIIGAEGVAVIGVPDLLVYGFFGTGIMYFALNIAKLLGH